MFSKPLWLGPLAILLIVLGSFPAYAQTGGVTGSVVLGDSSRCAHCDIQITPSAGGNDKKYSTTTDTQGRFLYLGLPSGPYMVQYSDPSTHEKLALEAQVAAGPPTTVNFDQSTARYLQGSGEIAGKFLLDGRPCGACTILIRPVEKTFGTETDSEGNFRYHLPAGEWRVNVRLPDGRIVNWGVETFFVGPEHRAGAELDVTTGPGNCLILSSSLMVNGKLTKVHMPGDSCPQIPKQ